MILLSLSLRSSGIFGLMMCLAGCTTAPNLNLNRTIDDNNQGKVTRIIDHIACELAKVKDTHSAFASYAAAAQLTIKIDHSGGLSPSLSFIKPLSAASTSRTIGIGGEYTDGSSKTFTQNFVFVIKGLKNACPTGDDPVALAGDLGLEEVVVAGLNAITDDNRGIRWAERSKGEIATAAEFGSTIAFTTKLAANGGPTLVRTKFKGFGGSNGLLNLSRVATDTLVIAFAPVATFKEPPPVPPQKSPPPSNPKLLQDQITGLPSFEKLLRDNANKQPAPPAETEADRQAKEATRRDAAEADARRDAVVSAKELLRSMILQNINATP